ncbi:MAG: SDR family oxidoreductase [Acidimicrobiales bacterium]
MTGRLEGRVAAITGGASGFGAETARLFVAEGAKVVLGDIQDDRLAAVVADIGDAARGVHCDVTSEDDIAGLVDTAVDEFGQLDVMFNNAGIIGAVGLVEATPFDEWRATLAILLDGVFLGMKHATRVMKPRERGSIVSMTSTAGVMGGLGPHAYTAAKHGVVGLTKSVAAEVGSWGIRVNCIGPHSMATPMVAQGHFGDPDAIDAVVEELKETSPLKGRPGLASDVANAALWLASDESGYTSGHCLMTDAGFTIGSRPEPPRYSGNEPMIREAGRRGL